MFKFKAISAAMHFLAAYRPVVVLVVAAVCGLISAWAAGRHIQQRVQDAEARVRVPMVERIVAASHLQAGTLLQPHHLALRAFPADYVSSDSVGEHELGELEGTRLRQPLRAGDPVLAAHVERTQPAAFSGKLHAGRRAITLPVDSLNALGGLLQPGDLIDLYVSFEHERRQVTAPLLQGVRVLATGADAQPQQEHEDRVYNTITLDATPEEAVKLVAARHDGRITAVLRSPFDADTSQVAARGDLASLLGLQRRSSVTRRARVIYGNKTNKSLPALAGLANTTPQGLFQLPYVPELSSTSSLDAGWSWNEALIDAISTHERWPPAMQGEMP